MIRIIAAFAISLISLPVLAQTSVGVTEWVNPSAWGTAPDAPERTGITQFRAMVRDESVETDASGAVDMIFERGARLLIGPECGLVLDETVYDPDLDEVTSFDVYTDTVCVVRAGAGAQTLTLLTPIAQVTIHESAASITYAAEDLAQLSSPSTDDQQSIGEATNRVARNPTSDVVDLVVVFEGGNGNGFVTVSTPTESRLLTRPGYMVLHAKDKGLSAPTIATTVSVRRVAQAFEGLAEGKAATSANDFDVAAPTLAEIDVVTRGYPFRLGLGTLPCAGTSFCDTATTTVDFGDPLTFP